MPTAAEHRREAASLSAVLDTIRVVRAEIVHDRDDIGVRGGTALLVGWMLDAAVTELEQLGRHANHVVDELHRRAGLCEQFTASVQRYEEVHRRWLAAMQRYRATAGAPDPAPWPGHEPVPPAPPFPGAVAG